MAHNREAAGSEERSPEPLQSADGRAGGSEDAHPGKEAEGTEGIQLERSVTSVAGPAEAGAANALSRRRRLRCRRRSRRPGEGDEDNRRQRGQHRARRGGGARQRRHGAAAKRIKS